MRSEEGERRTEEGDGRREEGFVPKASFSCGALYYGDTGFASLVRCTDKHDFCGMSIFYPIN